MEKKRKIMEYETFVQLRALYDEAYEENLVLKSQHPTDPKLILYQSTADEIETLTEVLSSTLQSIQSLLKYKSELIELRNSAKSELSERKLNRAFSQDSQISILVNKLTKSSEFLNSVTKEKKVLDSILEKTTEMKTLAQGKNHALGEKLKALENPIENLKNVQLTSLLNGVYSKQEVLQNKIEKYENYIQSKHKLTKA